MISLTASALRHPSDQLDQPDHRLDVQRRPPAGHHHERIQLAEVRPRGGEANQLSAIAVDVDPILAPGVAVVRELELPPTQRMERVGHPDDSCSILAIRCS